MRLKVILIGRNNSLIDDFFSQPDPELDFITSSQRYEDLLRHIELIKPRAMVYCLGRESIDDMNKLNSLKRRLERANMVLIAVGEKSDLKELEDSAPGACALAIPKPFEIDEVQRRIAQFIKGQSLSEQGMNDLRGKMHERDMAKYQSELAQEGGGAPRNLFDELADLENELSMEEDLVLPGRQAAGQAAPSAEGNAASAAPRQAPSLDQSMNKLVSPEPEEDEEFTGPKKHILIIDDDPLMLKIIKDHLHTRYDVGSAISGKVAYRFLEKRHTDLILLDYVMPEENGPTVLKHLRANEKTKNIPVVFLTGMQERGKIQEALSLKPQGYLLKPVDKKQLMGMVKSVIG